MDDLHNKFSRVVAQRKEDEVVQVQKYLESSRIRLLKILEKKFKTSFIGDLARVETYFGRLWGKDKPEEQLTENEKKWKCIWDELRTEILNNGNNQWRAAQTELQQYDVKWNKYQVNLKVPDVES